MGARPAIATAAAAAVIVAAVIVALLIARSTDDGSLPDATGPTTTSTASRPGSAVPIGSSGQTIGSTIPDATGPTTTNSTVVTDDRFVAVPDVIGLPVDDAADSIGRAGFTVNIVERIVSTESPGVVVAQSPTAGELRRPGTAVDLGVSIGDRPPGGAVVVPDVECLTLAEATEVLESAGFRVGEVTASFSGGPVDTTWLVERQRPSAGTARAAGDLVDLRLGSPAIVCI